MVCTNLSQLFVPWAYSWLVVVLAAAALVLIARQGGFSASDLGLGKHTMRKGVVWGGAAALAIFAALTIAYVIAPSLFADSRYDNGLWRALLQALIIIPLHTVIVEEFAFRGVLLASLHKVASWKVATIVSSIIFGLWHIVPSLGVTETSSVAGGSGIWPIVGIVFVTSLAGVAFCELRRRSGSLLAPILAHWAINGVAVVLAAFAWR